MDERQEGAYENINHNRNEGFVEDKRLLEEIVKFEAMDNSPPSGDQCVKRVSSSSSDAIYEDVVKAKKVEDDYDDVVVKTKNVDDGLYSFVGMGSTVPKDADDDRYFVTHEHIRPSTMPQSRLVSYLAIVLSVTAFATAVASMVITVKKVAVSLNGPTRDNDHLYIQELQRQNAQLTATLNTTVQRLNDLRNEVSDARSAAKISTRQQQMLENFTSAELQKQKEAILKLTLQVNNVTKMPSIVGPRGFNGSQGAVGPPGPTGAVNLSQCQYRMADSGGTSPGKTAAASVSVEESSGMKILGATCSTNSAGEYVFSARLYKGNQRYACECRGQAVYFTSISSSMNCFLHYWQCPTT